VQKEQKSKKEPVKVEEIKEKPSYLQKLKDVKNVKAVNFS